MVSTPKAKAPVIRESKINHKSPILHTLARFVTEETAAVLFNLKPDEIYRIDCWRYVVYVHGKSISKFVSYADFPPILGVEAPTHQDVVRWRKRWRKRWKSQQAPTFWTNFYKYHFQHAVTESNFLAWGNLVAVVKTMFCVAAVEQLREAYRREKYHWETFSSMR